IQPEGKPQTVFFELRDSNKKKIEGYLEEFGSEKSAIERSLKDRYQGKRTEKKLKGMFQRFNIAHGRVFTSKRDKQISDLATIMSKLQKDNNLNSHEKGIILQGALQSVIDNINSTEQNNKFKSRLLSICQEMQGAVKGTGVQAMDSNKAKIYYHSYNGGGVEEFRRVANETTQSQRKSL
ncbi:MAG TPA: hypothetical protein PLD88_13365, partial [Candidatus Berkiella sp.]|nr:hypothetical protein [Candidatus Berkiella sp.]